jgi:hypothetical protein
MTVLRRFTEPGIRLALGVVLSVLAGRAQAQEPTRVTVVVEQLAGNNVYLNAGTVMGIRTNDTLGVHREQEGPELGRFLIVNSTAKRSVVTFIGAPFPITRGDSLHLDIRPSSVPVAAGRKARRADPSTPTLPRSTGTQPARQAPHVSGRLSFDFSSIHSETEGLGGDPEKVKRDFNTPTAGLRMRVSQLPGGFQINTSVRVSHRSSTANLIEPSTSVRVYEASLERSFQALPLSIQLGRFYNRYETYSGYWDGLLLHYGKRFGIGAALGFEPDRLNQALSSDVPKYSVFLDYRHQGRSAGYRADVSFHQVRSDDGTPHHTFVGLSQRVRVRRFSLSQNLQVDRNPESDRWVVTRAQARASVPLGKRADFHAGYTLRQPYQFGRSMDVIPFRRDHVNVGLTFWVGNGTVSADVSAADQEGQARYYNYSSSLSFPRTGVWGLSVSVAGSYWTEDTNKGLLLSPVLSRSFGVLRSRLNYQYYRSETERYTITSHAADVSLSFPLSARIRSTLRARVSQGDNLSSTGLYTSLWMAF